jgi:DinB family protein
LREVGRSAGRARRGRPEAAGDRLHLGHRIGEIDAMDALGLFLLRYEAIHGGFVDELFAGLTDAQARARPHGLNSVVWLVWHATRVEDAAVSRFVGDRPQVLTEGDWRHRLGVDRRDVGSGMIGTEVESLSARIDTMALRGYARDVAERTGSVTASLAPAAWAEIVSPDRIRGVVAEEELLGEAGRWVEEFWARGHSRGWYLLQTALLHPYGHWFEAMATRGQLGAPGR